jgi:nitrate reductase NapE component
MDGMCGDRMDLAVAMVGAAWQLFGFTVAEVQPFIPRPHLASLVSNREVAFRDLTPQCPLPLSDLVLNIMKIEPCSIFRSRIVVVNLYPVLSVTFVLSTKRGWTNLH